MGRFGKAADWLLRLVVPGTSAAAALCMCPDGICCWTQRQSCSNGGTRVRKCCIQQTTGCPIVCGAWGPCFF